MPGRNIFKTNISQAEVELGCKMSVGYGMTENTCGTFLTAIGDVPEITTKTVGHPIPGCHGKIIDPETEEILEEGQIGELCTKGFMVFQGYVGDPGLSMNYRTLVVLKYFDLTIISY